MRSRLSPTDVPLALLDVLVPLVDALTGPEQDLLIHTCHSMHAAIVSTRPPLPKRTAWLRIAPTCAKMGLIPALHWAVAHGAHIGASTCCSSLSLQVLQEARLLGFPWDARTPSQAARDGRFEMVRWAHQHGCPWDESTCAAAAAGGHLELLQWVRAHGCPWDADTCTAAAAGGHSELLRWAYATGCSRDDGLHRAATAAAAAGHRQIVQWIYCDTNHMEEWEWREVAQAAAHTGNCEMLQWMKDHTTMPLNHLLYSNREVAEWVIQNDLDANNPKVCSFVAGVGDCELLQLALSKGYPWVAYGAKLAAQNGHMQILKYLKRNKLRLDVQACCASAAFFGHEKIVEFMHDESSWTDEIMRDVCIMAASKGHVGVLQFVLSQGYYIPSKQVSELAAQHGHISILKVLRESRLPMNRDIAIIASVRDHADIVMFGYEAGFRTQCYGVDLSLLEWLRERDVPWARCAARRLSEGASLQTLLWAVQNGCPCDATQVSIGAARAGNLPILRWVLDMPGLCKTEDACTQAAEEGHLGVLKWLKQHGWPWDEDVCIAASGRKDLDMLQWAHSQGCPVTKATLCAAEEGAFDEEGRMGTEKLAVLRWIESSLPSRQFCNN